MLVLTGMLISVVESLPETAYIKMVEIWLIFNLLLPFTDVLLHTTTDYLRYGILMLSMPFTRYNNDKHTVLKILVNFALL